MDYEQTSIDLELTTLRSDLDQLRRGLTDGVRRAERTLDQLQRHSQRAASVNDALRIQVTSLGDRLGALERRINQIDVRQSRLDSRVSLLDFRTAPATAASPVQGEATGSD